jgi:hypothetical protein
MLQVLELLHEGELALAEAPMTEMDRNLRHSSATALDEEF